MSKGNQAIALMTDSTANIPDKLVKEYSIYVIPQHVIWGTEDLLDGKDITAQKFYERLASDPVHPKTSQPPGKEFADLIMKAKKDGAKEVVICTVSSALSGTNDSAVQARSMVDIPVHVSDSKSAAMGLGWQVLAAARARAAGGDAKAMIAAADKVRANLAVVLTVDTLDYLHKGGRIGGAAKLIGTALNLKPQLWVNHDTGRIEPGERTRTRKKAVEATYQAFFSKLDTGKPLYVAVQHANALDEAQELVKRIKAEFQPKELLISDVPAVVGVHIGPGGLALCGYFES